LVVLEWGPKKVRVLVIWVSAMIHGLHFQNRSPNTNQKK